MWFTGHGHSLQVLCLFSLSWLALTSCAFCGVYWVSTSCQDLYWAFSHISHLVFPGAFHVNTQASCHRRRDWRQGLRFPDCGDEVLPTSSIHSTEPCTGHDSANTLGVGGRSLSLGGTSISSRCSWHKGLCSFIQVPLILFPSTLILMELLWSLRRGTEMPQCLWSRSAICLSEWIQMGNSPLG